MGFIVADMLGCFMFAAIPLAAFWFVWSRLRGTRAERWEAMGACGNCGYDLRESLFRCPECGTPIPEDQRVDLADQRNKLTKTYVKRPIDADELPVEVYVSEDESEIDRLKAQFKARGVKYDVTSQYPRFPRGRLTLRISVYDEDRARLLIEQVREAVKNQGTKNAQCDSQEDFG